MGGVPDVLLDRSIPFRERGEMVLRWMRESRERMDRATALQRQLDAETAHLLPAIAAGKTEIHVPMESCRRWVGIYTDFLIALDHTGPLLTPEPKALMLHDARLVPDVALNPGEFRISTP